MDAPTRFTERLKSLFDGRLRIRWSVARGEWHIEQKLSRGQVAPYFVSAEDDELIRARDGYGFVMAVRTGDRMPCPKCGFELKVPVLGHGEVRCAYCTAMGRDGRYAAGYYPLDGDLLLDKLKMLDPTRAWRDGIQKLHDARNQAVFAARERALGNHLEAATKDNWNQLVAIPHVGYTGRETMWDRS